MDGARPGEENGHRASLEHLLGDRSPQRAPQPTGAVGAENDQIDPLVIAVLGDAPGHVAFRNLVGVVLDRKSGRGNLRG